MAVFLVRRLISAAIVIWLVTLIVFVIIRAIPGDTLIANLGQTGRVPPQQQAEARRALGLDRSLPGQYVAWLSNLVQGDLGASLVHRNQDVRSRLTRASLVTVETVVMASMVGIALALLLALAAATRRGSWLGAGAMAVAALALAAPSFWLATVAIALLSRWFGYYPPTGYAFLWSDPLKNLEQHYIPAFILALGLAGPLARLLHASLLEAENQDYVRTARSKGLPPRRVLIGHVLRNALVPFMALYGELVTLLLAGSVILELMFNLPGLGSLSYQAVVERDYTQIEGDTLTFATIAVITGVLVNLVCARLDPRVLAQAAG